MTTPQITARERVAAHLPPAPETERYAGIAIGEREGALVIINADLTIEAVAAIGRAWPSFAGAVCEMLRKHRPAGIIIAGSREAVPVATRVGRLEGLAMASCGVMAGALTLREMCSKLLGAAAITTAQWDAIEIAKDLFPDFLALQPDLEPLTYAASLLAAASARLAAY